MIKNKWIICSVCEGEGKIDELGQLDPNSLDADDFEFYMEGGYDTICRHCAGSGKVHEGTADPIRMTGTDGQNVYYEDADDASEHRLRMAEGWC